MDFAVDISTGSFFAGSISGDPVTADFPVVSAEPSATTVDPAVFTESPVSVGSDSGGSSHVAAGFGSPATVGGSVSAGSGSHNVVASNYVYVPTVLDVRRSFQVSHPLTYLRDFHCNIIAGTTALRQHSYCISNHLSYAALSPSHKNLILQISSQPKPQYYHQAVREAHCRAAMQEELCAMEANNT
ncbi:hypothetical protein ACOSQ2_013123 [Xanthoceras sorbifolium]